MALLFFEKQSYKCSYCLCPPHQDENDVYILTKVSDILHAVFRSYKEKVLPWFEQLLQLIVQLIVSPLPGSLFVVSLSK